MLIVIFKGLLYLLFSNIFTAGSDFSSISSVVERSCFASEYSSCTDSRAAQDLASFDRMSLPGKKCSCFTGDAWLEFQLLWQRSGVIALLVLFGGC